MKKSQKIDAYYIIEPLCSFAKLFGLWPQTLRRSSPGVSTISLIWFFIVFSIYIYCFYLNLQKDFWNHFNEVTKSSIQTYGTWVQILSGLLIGMISLAINMCTYRKQWTFFETICEVDEILTKDFNLVTPKKVFRYFIYCVVFVMNIGLIILVVSTYFLYESFLKISNYNIYISYYLSNLPYMIVISIFCFSVSTIRRRMIYINNLFGRMFDTHIAEDIFKYRNGNSDFIPTIEFNEIYSIYSKPKDFKKSSMKKNQIYKTKEEVNREIQKVLDQITGKEVKNDSGLKNLWKEMQKIQIEEYRIRKCDDVDKLLDSLTKLVDLHDKLLDCMNFANELLSFQILMIVAQIFVFGVFAWFSLYRVLYSSGSESSVLAFTNFFWICYYDICMATILSIAHGCVNEAKFTGTAVHKVINKIANHADERIIEKLSVISHQMKMRNPIITCGLFQFDWSLQFSLFSATAIYLIFLVQFDIAGNPQTPQNKI